MSLLKVVSVAVTRDGRYLLVYNNSLRKWEFPILTIETQTIGIEEVNLISEHFVKAELNLTLRNPLANIVCYSDEEEEEEVVVQLYVAELQRLKTDVLYTDAIWLEAEEMHNPTLDIFSQHIRDLVVSNIDILKEN